MSSPPQRAKILLKVWMYSGLEHETLEA